MRLYFWLIHCFFHLFSMKYCDFYCLLICTVEKNIFNVSISLFTPLFRCRIPQTFPSNLKLFLTFINHCIKNVHFYETDFPCITMCMYYNILIYLKCIYIKNSATFRHFLQSFPVFISFIHTYFLKTKLSSANIANFCN